MGSVNAIPASLWEAATRGPQVDTPTEASAKALTLGNLAQQGQLHKQQMQMGQLELQQHQQDFQDQQKLRQLYMDSGGDLDKLQQSAMKSGVSPKAVMAIQQQKLTMQKEIAGYDELRLKNETSRHDALRGELTSFLSKPDDEKEQGWNPWIQSHVANGHLTGPEAAQLLQQYPTYPGDDQMKLYANGLATGSQLAKEETERRTAAARELTADTGQKKLTLETPGLQADAAMKERANAAAQLGATKDQAGYAAAWGELPARIARSFPPPEQFDPIKTPAIARQLGMSAEQQTQATQAAANAAQTAAHNKVDEQQGAQRVGIEGGRLALEKQRFGFDTNGVSPAAQMAADGRMDPGTLKLLIRSNPGIVAQIQRVDPQFDEANIANRYNTLKEFTSTSNGKAGGQALALNTLIHHADLYMQTAEALKNGSFVPGNAVYNAVAQAFGSAPPTNAALVARFFAGETGKVATGGVPAEGEINGILKNLGTSASPDQIAGAGKTLLQIAAGRATPLMERAQAAKIDKVVQVLGPDAKQILARRGYDPNTMKPAAGQGGGAAPKVGDVQQGYRFKGGNPADQKNWEKVQ